MKKMMQLKMRMLNAGMPGANCGPKMKRMIRSLSRRPPMVMGILQNIMDWRLARKIFGSCGVFRFLMRAGR